MDEKPGENAPFAMPLRYRLPNPPPSFLGRAADRAWLAEAVRRAPLTLVCGLGGLGKTSLVRQVLFEDFADKVSRVVAIGLEPGDAPMQIAVEVLKALTPDDEGLDWTSLHASPERLVATAIDRVEQSGAWVTIDDLQHADPRGDSRGMEALLRSIAKYARASRWIAIGRLTPLRMGLEEQTRTLGALEEPELRAMAARLAPSIPPASLAPFLEQAAGSPWRLRQVLAGRALHGPEHSLRSGLSDAAMAVVDVLAAVRISLPPSTLARLAPSDAHLIDDLMQRGLVERSGLGYRLHDVARSLLAAETTFGEMRAVESRIIEPLATSGDSSCALEAARIALAHEAWRTARAIIEAHRDALASPSVLPKLWELLASCGHEELAQLRLETAVELGDPVVLGTIAEPTEPTPAMRLSWGRALFGRGEFARAARALEDAAQDARARFDSARAFEAELMAARALALCGRAAEARAHLDAAHPTTSDEHLLHDAALGGRMVSMGHYERALETIRRAEARLATSSMDAEKAGWRARALRREAARDVVDALVRLGRVNEARDAMARWLSRGAAPHYAIAPREAGLDLLVLARGGDFAAARDLIDRYREPTQGAPALARFLRSVAIECDLAMGRFERLDADIDAQIADATQARDAHHLGNALGYRAWLALWRADGSASLEWPKSVPEPEDGATARMGLRAVGEAIALDRDEELRAEGVPSIDSSSPTILQSWFAQLAARRAPQEALASVRACADRARDAGWMVHAWESRRLEWDLATATGDAVAAASARRALQEIAARLSSPRLRAELTFVDLASTEIHASPRDLEACAALGDSAPIASRRARALLGTSAPLGRVDRAVLDALRTRWSPVHIVTRGTAWRPGFTIDASAGVVWLPNGAHVDLTKRPLLVRFLESLFDHESGATKADLAREVWDVADYHPHRDDKRMQVAVRELRRILEDDPSQPSRVITLEDGYALGKNDREQPRRVTTSRPRA